MTFKKFLVEYTKQKKKMKSDVCKCELLEDEDEKKECLKKLMDKEKNDEIVDYISKSVIANN